MKACFITKCGDVDTIQIGEQPDPKIGQSQVLIGIKSAALNHLDIWVRMGRPGMVMPFPHILGSDSAGVIIETGAEVTKAKVGDEVAVYPGIHYEYYSSLRVDEEPYGILGLTKPGVFAEYVVVDENCVFPKPHHLTFQETAAVPIPYLTAWRMLFTKGNLQPGETVLIHGIGGGVAQAALSLALTAGAEVIVTSSSSEKLRRAAELGAHHTINYMRDDIVQHVLAITQGVGVNLALDAVGAKTMPVNIECTCRQGRITLCGVTTGQEVPVDLQTIYWKQLQIFGSTMGSIEEFCQVLSALTATNGKPVIDSEYTIDDVQKATQRMEDGKQFGKIVLNIS